MIVQIQQWGVQHYFSFLLHNGPKDIHIKDNIMPISQDMGSWSQ